LAVVGATVAAWPWLEQHLYKIGLYIVAFLLVGTVAWTVADKKRRRWSIFALALSILVALIPIIGGAS
jgi:uncharacterized membrane protein SirB2